MKLKDGVIVSKADGSFYAVDAGLQGRRFSGIIKMNETAEELLRLLKDGSDEEGLTRYLCEKYEVEPSVALADIRKVLTGLRFAGFICE